MNLESQVAPLELALRLRELGFPQDTAFKWAIDVVTERLAPVLRTIDDESVRCAAPTVAEMGEWMPTSVGVFTLTITRTESDWSADYGEFAGIATTEAEARARLLIALAEAGAIKPGELK